MSGGKRVDRGPGLGLRRGSLDRREFLKVVGGGIAVAFAVGVPVALPQSGSGAVSAAEDFNAYLRIGEDGRVSLFTGKIEMGQGIVTSLAQMLAEELEVPLAAVDVIMGDTALCPWDRGTFGSLSTKQFGVALRWAAAEARSVLIEIAAEKLQAPPAELVVREGEVIDRRDSGRRVPYSELTKGKRIDRRLEGEPPLKHHRRYLICGRPTGRIDAREKVTGEALFAGDIRLPGQMYARILRPPAHGARLRSVDTSPAEKIDGVRVVRDDDLIAVLHQLPDVADRALESIRAEYEIPPPSVTNESLFDHLVRAAPAPEVVTSQGDVRTGRKLAGKSFDSTYSSHYVAHAPMEPHTAVARFENGNATVWASTQTPFGARQEVAEALGVASDQVRIITPFVGGGFGGKSRNRQAVEAARLAWAAGRPVQVAWTRREEFFFDSFRPATVIKVSSGLDAEDRMVYWDYDNHFGGARSSEPIYSIPHHRVVTRSGWREQDDAHPFAVGAWRGPASNSNVFAMESQVDIMAEAAGADPLEFRLQSLTDPRLRRVLAAAAERFGHRFARAPSGRGHGIACTIYHGTYVATMAEVSVDRRQGAVRVERVVCAQDMGEVINPAGARQQIEGCITMGLGYALSEEIRFEGGRILDRNFDTYRLPRFSWQPEIETVLIDNPDLPPQGCGEPAITSMGGMIANAIYDAVGIRMFELPMTPERVKRALARPSDH